MGCPWEQLLLLQLPGILVFRPGAGGGLSTLPGVGTILLVGVADGALALAALGGLLLGLGPLGLHAERRHRLLQVLVILLDCCHRLTALVAALAAVGSEPEGVSNVRHLTGGVVKAGCRHVVADIRWQPVEEVSLEQHALWLTRW